MASFTMHARRGQTNAEFVLFLTVVLAMVVAFAVPAFQSYELSVALSATREGMGTFIAANRTYTLGAIGFTVTGPYATLHPHVYQNGIRMPNGWADAQPARTAALRAIAHTFRQTVPDDAATNVTGFTYTYSIDFNN